MSWVNVADNASTSIFHSIQVTEPERWERLMLMLNEWMIQTDRARSVVPVTADLFVFSYPLFLVWLYGWGIIKATRVWKERALQVFASAMGTFAVNWVIQLFGEKSRPEAAVQNQEWLILEHLPTDPFPSDHAAVSMSVAVAVLLIWYHSKVRWMQYAWCIFLAASIIMSLSRVMVAIHRPTDILVGWWVGILVAYCIALPSVSGWLKETVYAWLIRFEEVITWVLWFKKST